MLHALHSSTSTYMSNFIEIEGTLWTDGRTYGQIFETHFIRRVDLMMVMVVDGMVMSGVAECWRRFLSHASW